MFPIITKNRKIAMIWNKIYQQHNDREEFMMLSIDSVISSNNKLPLPQYIMHDIKHVTIPPHRLRLKIGDICRLIRSIKNIIESLQILIY